MFAALGPARRRCPGNAGSRETDAAPASGDVSTRAGQRSCVHGPAPRAGVPDPLSSGRLRSVCAAGCSVPAAGRVSAGGAGRRGPVGRLRAGWGGYWVRTRDPTESGGGANEGLRCFFSSAGNGGAQGPDFTRALGSNEPGASLQGRRGSGIRGETRGRPRGEERAVGVPPRHPPTCHPSSLWS